MSNLVRSEVEQLFFDEMVQEDANYLIMGDPDINAIEPELNDALGVFSSTDDEQIYEYLEDDDDALLDELL